jgi:TrmH RNA methyltransferase
VTKKKSPPRPADKRPAAAHYGSSRKELKYYGVAACLALWQQRPDDVIRIYVTEETLKQFSALLKWAATTRRAYHIVSNDDLERLTESIHHQGICLLALEPESVSFMQFKQALSQQNDAVLIGYLDGVENPHNLGAIVRSCAHFGIAYLLGEAGKLPKLSPSACRVAEGGAEHVKLVAVNDGLRALAELKKLGFVILTTAADGASVYEKPFPTRTLLVMGAEQSGVSAALHKIADAKIKIPGSGQVESLNVSVAFAILAAEFVRQHY